MPPVEATATVDGSRPSAAAVAPCVLAASSSPRLPVAALAHPELARIARRASSLQRSLLSRTGAAGAAVAVKRAALTGFSASQTSSARSGLPLGLIPHVTPAARKPAGSPESSASSRTCPGTGTQRERKKGGGGPSELRSPYTSLPALIGVLASPDSRT